MVYSKDANEKGSQLSSETKSSKVVALRTRVNYRQLTILLVLGTFLVLLYIPHTSPFFLQLFRHSTASDQPEALYWKLRTHGLDDEPDPLCEGMYTRPGTKAISHSGYIGLNGDSEDTPKRSFFWFFEAQDGNKSAPVILTMGGGPGVSGLLNTLIGQSHCKLTKNATTEPNPHAWTEKFNLIALDHPVNVGFSYGSRVHNSREAAYDVYDFLQKLYVLFPHLVGNPLILSGGSYGGTYIPHIATVIHESNLALASSPRLPTSSSKIPINLDSIMLSNPHTDALSHYTWSLHYRCTLSDLYNSTVCSTVYPRLPACLDAIRLVYQDPDVLERRVRANELCQETQLQKLDGRSYENVNVRCNGTLADCFPEAEWLSAFLNNPETKHKLGVPAHLNFSSVNQEVHRDFIKAGDIVQPAHWMYPPLLEAGVRLLHYVGKLDANCPWPGTLSMLNLLQTPLQSAFLTAPDLPWISENATVRVVYPPEKEGGGAGQLTYVAIEDSGHMVVKDQPALVKKIVERWVLDQPFDTADSKDGV